MNGIYGRAATGLQDTSWAVNEAVAKMGAKGEKKSEEILNRFGESAAVMHDLHLPIPGFKANIDHIIVSGKRVLILDSKMWKPGFYWTFSGTNRRGLEKVPHTAKDQGYIQRAIISHLSGTGAEVGVPKLAVWPSREDQKLSLWLLQVPGAHVITGTALAGVVRKFIGRKPADDQIVKRLATLLVHPHVPAQAQPAAAARDSRHLADPEDVTLSLGSRPPQARSRFS